MVNPQRVNGNGQEETQFCFERVEGSSCMHGLGICRSSPFFRICIRDSDEDLMAVPLVQSVEQCSLWYAGLCGPVDFPRFPVFSWFREEGYDGGVLAVCCSVLQCVAVC